jgi:hypothetical protein
MRPIRLGALLFAAVVTISSVAAGSTLAAENPLFNPASGQTVRGEAGVTAFASKSGAEARCASNKITSGEVRNGLSLGKLVIHFLGCIWTGGAKTGCEANSVGQSGGLIVTTTLRAILGVILPSASVGLLFLPESGTEWFGFIQGECEEETTVTGNLVAKMTPIRETQTEVKAIFELFTVTDFDITHGIGLVKPKLVAFASASSMQAEDTLTYGVATEIT